MYNKIPKKLYILFLGKIIMELGAYIWPLFTLMSVDVFEFSKPQTAFFLTVFMICNIIGTLIGGKLTDMFGRKYIFSFFMGFSALFYFAAGFAEPNIIIICLAVGGFMVSIGAQAITPIIIDMCETPEQKDQAFTLYYIAMNLGFTLGPLIGGFLYDLGWLRFLFIGDGLTTFIFAFIVLLFIPETKPSEEEYQKLEGTTEQASNESILKIVVRNKVLFSFLISMGLLFLVFRQFTFGFSLHAEYYFSNPGTLYGISMTINSLMVVILTSFIIKMVKNVSMSVRIALGGLLYMIGFGMLAFTGASVVFYFVSVAIWTLGEILISPSAKVFISNHTPVSHRGRFSSVFDLTRQFGGILGLNIAGYVIEYSSIETMWLIMGAIALIGSLISYKIYSIEKER
jgi:MFS family permease